MGLASFRINQPPGSGYTYWDRARRDLVPGTVECEAQNTSESSYLWEIISAPPGETISITNPTSSTCSFTLTTRYGYLVRLTVNAGEIDEQKQTLYMGIPLTNSGACLPALNETNQDNSQDPYDGSRGFEEKVSAALIAFDGGFSWVYDIGDDYLYPQSNTAALKVGDGDAADPGYGFYTDQDTGVFLQAEGVLGFSAGGVELHRTYYESGSPVIETLDREMLTIRNVKSAAAAPVGVTILSQASATCTGANMFLKAEGDNGKAIGNQLLATSPGGATAIVVSSDTTGAADGSSSLMLRAIGAGTPTVDLIAETTGGYESTLTIRSKSDGANSNMVITSESTNNLAFLEVGANGSSTGSRTILGGNSQMEIRDRYQSGSGYTGTFYLAQTGISWSLFATRFGATTDLISSILSAGSQDLQSAYDEGATIDGNVVINPTSGTLPGLYINYDGTGDAALSVSPSSYLTTAWFRGANTSGSTVMRIGYYYDDGVHLALSSSGASYGNNHFMFTNNSNLFKDHDQGTAHTDLRVFIYSAADVDTDNTEYMVSYVTSGTGVATITTGKGYLRIGESGTPYLADGIGDFFVGTDAEIGGNFRAGRIGLYTGATEWLDIYPRISDGPHFAAYRNVFIFTSQDNITKYHGINTIFQQPTLYFFSSTDVDTDDTRWARMYVDTSSNFRIEANVGGYLHLEDTGLWADAPSLFEDVVDFRVSLSTGRSIRFTYNATVYSEMSLYPDDGHHWGFNSGNMNLILTTYANMNRDHDRYATETSPTLYLFSATDPDSNNTQWISLHREAAYGEFLIGGGYCRFGGGPMILLAGQGFWGTTAQTTLAISTGVVTVNWNNNNFYYVSVTQNITSWSITNPTNGVGRFQVLFYANGTRTIDFPTAWYWDGPEPPFSMTASQYRMLTVYYNGSSYFATMSNVYQT